MLMVWFACASSTGADDNAPATVESHALLEGHGPTEGIHSLALDEDAGKLYSGGGDSTIRVWQVRTARRMRAICVGQRRACAANK